MHDKLSLEKSLQKTKLQIEKKLHCEVTGIQRITKVYGANANSFLLHTIDNNNNEIRYFLKFLRKQEKVQAEKQAFSTLSPFTPTAHIILSSDAHPSWILEEYIDGSLMSEIVIEKNQETSSPSIVELEHQKELMLQKLYQSPLKELTHSHYLKLRANSLFYQRLYGKRYHSFYEDNPEKNISRVFTKKVIVNGYEYPETIADIFDHIRRKYDSPDKKTIKAHLGHGDAHHGNCLLDVNGKMWLIDAEYSDTIPVYMELSKPYYNDFLGTLIFHYHDMIRQFFKVSNVKETKEAAFITIDKPKTKPALRLAITREKLDMRKKDLDTLEDFLSLNDYLILCHTLTKNPNNYPSDIQALFVALTLGYWHFDARKPESLYEALHLK
jgi:hypothetical protein